MSTRKSIRGETSKNATKTPYAPHNDIIDPNEGPEVFYRLETRTYLPLTPIRPITPSYMPIAHQTPVTSDQPKKLLVILDLNGTLFYRADDRNRTVTSRPHLNMFLKFIFEHCRVMVWSSARPMSVDAMLKSGFGKWVSRLDRVWSRDHFRLHQVDYKRKVLTLKDLEYVWEEIEQEKQYATQEELDTIYDVHFDQTNTVLIDDSTDKSQLQPYNCLVLTDFTQQRALAKDDIELLKIRHYLEKLIHQENVSAFMRVEPFRPDSEDYEAESFVKQVQSLVKAQQKKLLKNLRKKEKKKAAMKDAEMTQSPQEESTSSVTGTDSDGNMERVTRGNERKRKERSQMVIVEGFRSPSEQAPPCRHVRF